MECGSTPAPRSEIVELDRTSTGSVTRGGGLAVPSGKVALLNDSASVRRAREIALQAVAGHYDLLLACRDLSDLRDQLTCLSDHVMDVFIGVASEVDGLPIGAERRYWAAESLAAKDIELNRYRDVVRHVVIDALYSLLAAIGTSGERH